MPKQKSRAPMAAPDADAVLDWYDRHSRALPWRTGPADRKRGMKPDPYRVWLSEVMLQQTTVATVGRYYARFLELWPKVGDLAAAPLDAVLVEWAGLGYYARARNLHACAQAVAERFGGAFPTRSAELLTLPGVGPYTAAAIAAIAGDEQIAVLDGNVERVMARFLALEQPVRLVKDEVRATLQTVVPPRAGDFAQAMMDLGATICAPRNANCLICPLAEGCAGRRDNPLRFPVKGEKKRVPVRFGHAFVIRDADGDVYLRKRAGKGLLAQMTEVPVSEWGDVLGEPAFPPGRDWRQVGEVVHVFTHFALTLKVWTGAASDREALDEGWWTSPGALGGEALPTLFRKVLAAAGLEVRR